MKPTYILDACALIAFFADEPGAERVTELLRTAEAGGCSLFLHKVNLLEIYYGIWCKVDKSSADDILRRIANSPITIVDQISDAVLLEAARLKAFYRISLADAIALAEAKSREAQIVTCDHHEFDLVEKAEPLAFCWIR